MKREIVIALVISALIAGVRAQDTLRLEDTTIVYGMIIADDTILLGNIDPVIVYPTPTFESRRELRRYNRLVRNVKKVYPFAKMAGEKYDTVEAKFLTMKTERERKAYIKQVEQEIMDEYEDDLKKLTITQGRILLKLIDREIGETSYDLLKEFKGTFSAFFWQTLARIFGHNLKSEFDPEGEDKLLNEIVILIENGQL